jgi:hypothetical protein
MEDEAKIKSCLRSSFFGGAGVYLQNILMNRRLNIITSVINAIIIVVVIIISSINGGGV